MRVDLGGALSQNSIVESIELPLIVSCRSAFFGCVGVREQLIHIGLFAKLWVPTEAGHENMLVGFLDENYLFDGQEADFEFVAHRFQLTR